MKLEFTESEANSKSKKRVICLGLACLDYRFTLDCFPPRGRRQPVRSYREALGGPAAVAAMTVARLEGSAVLWSRRGDDLVGQRVAQLLNHEGVNTTYFRAFTQSTSPVSSVFITSDGERYLFPFWGKDLPEDPHWLPLDHLSAEDTCLVDLRWPTGALHLARAARNRQVPLVVDMDQDLPEAWALVELATHVVADENLAAKMGGTEQLLRRFEQLKTWGAVTLGSQGVVHPGGRLRAFKVEIVDTTGAGDVFHGAFALGLSRGMAEEEALHFASAAGALRCQLGEVPHAQQVERLLQQYAF